MTELEFNTKIKELCSLKSLSVFEKNVLGCASYLAPLAKRLLEIKALTYKVEVENDDISSLNIFGEARLYNAPKQEVAKQLKDFEDIYSLYPALFIYGLGNGVLVKSLLENPNHKTIIVFEPEIDILFIVFNFIDFSRVLLENRLVIVSSAFFSSVHYRALMALDSVLDSAKIYNLYINTCFYERFKDDILLVNKNISNIFRLKILEFGNDTTDALIGLKQTLAHIPAMLNGVPLSQILATRKGKVKTAVIVSTGPSLNKQLELLKQIEGKVTIIAADSSYAVLKKHGICPDFVTSIERESRTSETFNSEVSAFDDDIIFVCATLTHANTLKYLKGRNVALIFRPLPFEEAFGDTDYGYLGRGQSCAHLSYNLAEILEHEKIIFIGQDLAYGENLSTHSADFIYGASDKEVLKSDLEESYAPAYGGNGVVRTWSIWNAFREQFELLFATRKNKNLQIYNATEGGARMGGGCVEKPFKELVNQILNETKPSFEIPKPFSQKIINKKLQKYSKIVNKTLSYGESLQKEIESIFLELKEVLENKNHQKLKSIIVKINELDIKLKSKEFKDSYYLIAISLIENSKLEFTKIKAQKINEDEKNLIMANARMPWLFNLADIISVTRENIENNAKDWLLER